MAGKEHFYRTELAWDSDDSTPTVSYAAYSRDHQVSIDGKERLNISADPAFRGSADLWNPEDQLVASLSSCHMLTYLAQAARNKLTVLAYRDAAYGVMVEEGTGGHFSEVGLNPVVTLAAGSDEALAEQLHHEAHEQCFIANSVNFPVHCKPTFIIKN